MPTTSPDSLAAVFKAYDVRGTVPDQVDDDLARAVGSAFVQVTGAAGGAVVVGHDMRPSSPGMARAFAEGASRAGADVTLIGLASTDQLYFASGHRGVPGAMFTASHNPAQYNGIKMCRANAVPLGMDTGLADVRDLVAAGEPSVAAEPGTVDESRPARRLRPAPALAGSRHRPPAQGRRRRRQRHGRAHRARGARRSRPRRRAAYYELDGTFPNHEANPIEPANLVDLQAAVLAEGADIGLAFDGDADRCFVVDENGGLVSPSVLTALIASRELAAAPRVDGDPQPDHLARRARAGHRARRHPGPHPGGPLLHQGHDGRDRRRLRRGALGPLLLPRLLARRLRACSRRCTCSPRWPSTDRPLSELLAEFSRYVDTGEINSDGAPTRPPRSPRSSRSTAPATASRSTTSTGSPSATATGGSTSARPTPSRCCGSTSRPGDRRPGPAARRRPRLIEESEPDEPRPGPARDHRVPALPRLAGRRRRRPELVCTACGRPTRCATTSRCCSSTRRAARDGLTARCPRCSTTRGSTTRPRSRAPTTTLRRLAEAGARVRREAGEPREAIEQAVAVPPATPARARSSPPAPTPGCSGPCSSRGARCRSWRGPARRCPAGRARSTSSWCSPPTAATPARPPRSPRRSAAAAAAGRLPAAARRWPSTPRSVHGPLFPTRDRRPARRGRRGAAGPRRARPRARTRTPRRWPTALDNVAVVRPDRDLASTRPRSWRSRSPRPPRWSGAARCWPPARPRDSPRRCAAPAACRAGRRRRTPAAVARRAPAERPVRRPVRTTARPTRRPVLLVLDDGADEVPSASSAHGCVAAAEDRTGPRRDGRHARPAPTSPATPRCCDGTYAAAYLALGPGPEPRRGWPRAGAARGWSDVRARGRHQGGHRGPGRQHRHRRDQVRGVPADRLRRRCWPRRIHSVADSGNQVLLLVGGKRAEREATAEHPFGYGRERYVYAFLVAIVLFSVGGLFALYEAYHKAHEVHEGHAQRAARRPLVVGARSSCCSPRSWWRGCRSGPRSGSRNHDPRRGSWVEFIRRAKAPELPVILLEDFAALIGLVLRAVRRRADRCSPATATWTSSAPR